MIGAIIIEFVIIAVFLIIAFSFLIVVMQDTEVGRAIDEKIATLIRRDDE